MSSLKKLIPYLIILFVITVNYNFQVKHPDADFKVLWEKVDNFKNNGQPKSALAIVDNIYKLAKSNNNNPQIIKSLLYRISLQSSYQEDYTINSIHNFEAELQVASTPEKQILQSLIAELYHSYYSSNRWNIAQRQVIIDNKSKDIKTWSAQRLNEVIDKYYTASLKNNTLLKQIKLSNFADVLSKGDLSNFTFWPSLYDLLANRALNYFTSTDAQLSNIGSPAISNNTNFLQPANKFVNISINPNKSSLNKALNIFQKLLAFHIKQNNVEALVDLDLRRLQYVFDNSLQNKINTGNYITALKQLADSYRNKPEFVSVAYVLAKQYYISGSNYVPGFDESNRYKLIIADSICKLASTTFPNANGVNNCLNLIEEINKISFDLDLPIGAMPNKPILSLVKFKNVNKLYFKIIASSSKEDANKNNRRTYIFNQLNKQKPMLKWVQQLPQTNDRQLHSVEIKIPKLTPGYYIIFASNDSLFSRSKNIIFKSIWITNLSYITNINKADGSADMFTINRETGKRIADVNITVFKRKYDNRKREYVIKETGKLTTDKYGYAKIKPTDGNNYRTYLFMFEKDGNKLFSENYMNFYNRTSAQKPKTHTYLFTDRAVYHPGQVVYFKGVTVKESEGKVKLLANFTTEVDFVNAGRKKINTQNFTTNINGSFSGEFSIPTGGLNGQMTIKCKTGNVTIMVEDYKLPTFEVLFDSLKGQPKLGNEVTITGKALSYSGSIVNGATVAYRVTRRVILPLPFYKNNNLLPPNIGRDVEITNGSTTTSSDGIFTFQFNAVTDGRIPEKAEPNYNYQIYAEVTDISGEVQLASTNVSIGSKTVLLNIEMPDLINAKKINDQFITAKNLSGTNLIFNASISIFKLTPPLRLLTKQQWQLPDLYIIPEHEFKQDFPHAAYKNEENKNNWPKQKVLSKQVIINGKTAIDKKLLSDLSIGEYLITINGNDVNGKSVATKHFFTLFSSANKKLPGNMISWFAISKKEAEPGETLKLVVGTAAKKSQLMYEIMNGNNIVERQWVTISKGQKIIDIPVLESYRGNFSINIAMVKFNHLYSNKLTVNVPFTNKKLDIKLNTFRNHLTPGAKEVWSVTVSGANNNKLASQLLAGMYDASLDVFKANNWQMKLYHNKLQARRWESNQFTTAFSSALNMPDIKYYQPKQIHYPQINWFGFQFNGSNYFVQGTMDGGMRKSEVLEQAANVDNNGNQNNKDQNIVTTANPPKNNKQKTIIPLRNNFNETAFFYPNLVTDSAGNVTFKFTTPDALTEWKIMMLAYTNNLKVGTFVKKIKSQKELMIIPNAPRFVRQGDTLKFTAKVINFTDKEIVAKANIEFFDALSMRPASLFVKGDTESKTIAAKQSTTVSWTLIIPNNVSMIGYRITASTPAFSDGEERMFPVLTNRKLVTNTLPMNVTAHSTADFTFSGLANKGKHSTTLSNYRYTVEFTSNPAWYAIQALPYLSTPKNKSNTAIFNSYFANALSSFIVASNPKIKSVFESWKNSPKDAFLSNLEKNQSLKSTILSSTPWVLDAEKESYQKRQLAVLFDANRMENEKQNYLNQLRESQLPSGAWPWFKGMRADRHTTQTIVLGMAKLNDKGVVDLTGNNRRYEMIRRAVAWLDGRIVEDFEKLKKNNGNQINSLHVSSTQTQYLYLRALLINLLPIPKKSKAAFDYYVEQEKKYWLKQSNYLQGMIAISLNKFGFRNESEAIIRSLKERALYSKEMGMYWRQDAGWNWYNAPVETQAMMIEAMDRLTNDSNTIEQLKLWLLKQKQTQHWTTSSATAEAIFALLMNGNNILNDNNMVNITVGNNTINVAGNPDDIKQAGTGYFSTSWSGNEITPEMANITVTNINNHVAWGAAYWQYFEKLDKIKAYSSPLSVTKKLFVEKQTNNGPVLEPFKPKQVLKTGDKVVVRLIITSDRDIDYVQLTDMRATTFESASQTSGYSYGGGLWYYKNITDVSTEFFIRSLRKGTYVLEYPLYITQRGSFTNGIATIQSMYAPEFAAHSSGLRIDVGE